MMESLQILLVACLGTLLIPLVTYLSVKLGTYAYYRARYLSQLEEPTNGEISSTEGREEA